MAGPAAGRVPAIHVLRSMQRKTWMAVTSRAMTIGKNGANYVLASSARAVARLEMAPVDMRLERPAGRLLDDLRCREARALAVHIGAQPGQQRREIAAGDAGQDGGIGALGRVEELCRGHGAQGVGRKIA